MKLEIELDLNKIDYDEINKQIAEKVAELDIKETYDIETNIKSKINNIINEEVRVMIEIKMPNKCKECRFVGAYLSGIWARNPHYCCELMYDLYNEDYKVNPDTIDEECPLSKGITVV